MGNVSVYQDSTAEILYNMEAIYLSKDDFDFVLEMPFFSDTIPEKIEETTFNNEIEKKINKHEQKLFNSTYSKNETNYELNEKSSYNKKLKIRKIFEKIGYNLINNDIINTQENTNG